jgi:hypothetical protein
LKTIAFHGFGVLACKGCFQGGFDQKNLRKPRHIKYFMYAWLQTAEFEQALVCLEFLLSKQKKPQSRTADITEFAAIDDQLHVASIDKTHHLRFEISSVEGVEVAINLNDRKPA